jgi:DNA-directed RNA polymerase specialized sigma24 family protein
MTWLERIAIRRLIDFERSRRRSVARESTIAGDVEAMAIAAAPAEEPSPGEAWIAEHRSVLLAVAQTDAEQAFIKARLEDAPRDVQAVALGVDQLPSALARAEMNRVWELLGRRARRHWRRCVMQHPNRN